MSLTYNSAELQGITWNGDDVQVVTMDGVEVWSAIKPNLKDNTPAQIQYAAQHDLAASLWDIGDWFEMTLNGNWQCTDNVITLNNYVIRCVLIGINHNASLEGNHLLHFQMGKNTDNVDVAFNSSKMNTENTSSGGWKSCKMRTITMANLYNTIIPSNWRAVIKPCTKYTNNTGDGKTNASYVTATSDNCFLFAEYEILGYNGWADDNESTKQKQYAYYANGNSKAHFRHDIPTLKDRFWLRSPAYLGSGFACTSRADSRHDSDDANDAHIFSPAFCIG